MADTKAELGGLDLALVSVALHIGERYDVRTELAVPVNQQSIEEACEVIAKLGSPPLRVSVARDLASAGFTTAQLRPLLASTLGAGIASTDDNLDVQRNELRRIGPTVSWPGFPPGPQNEPAR